MLMKDIDTAWSSRICEYCNRYRDGIRVTRLLYARGRKLRWVTTCWDCSNQPEFYGYDNHELGRIYTVDQFTEVYSSIERVVKEYGKPIPLVDAVKLAAASDSKVRDFFKVNEYTSEDDPILWELIYQIVGDGTPPESGLVTVVLEPRLVVKYIQPKP